jgi:hypothetical protein
MEREVHAILGPLGVKETLSRLVAEDLRAIEDSSYDMPDGGEVMPQLNEGVDRPLVRSVQEKEHRGRWFWDWRKRKGGEEEGGLRGGVDDEMGLTAFLLKFGEGLGTL